MRRSRVRAEVQVLSKVPPASLAALAPYPVPAGGRLGFRYVVETTDGFMRGDVVVAFGNGTEERVVAHNVPVKGSARQVKALGDYAKLFPEPIPVLKKAVST